MIAKYSKNMEQIFSDAPIVLFPILLLAPILIQGQVLFWGLPSLQFIPWRVFAYENLIKGILPLWNPLNGLGTPLLANYQLAFFYPPGWILFVFWFFAGPSWLAWAHTLLILIHLIWAGLGLSRLIRILGYGKFSQAISGIAFSLCAYWVARAGFFSMIWAGAWLPWIILETSKLTISREKYRWKALSSGLVLSFAFQLLAGHAQLTFYSLILAFFWLIFQRLNSRDEIPSVKIILRFFIALGMACLLSSIQLLPTLEFLLESQRASLVKYETALTYSFWPWRFLTFIAPDIFGNPKFGNFWGYASYWEDAVYFGLVPFLLAVSTIRILFISGKTYPKSEKKFILFLWALIVTGSILALGKNTPIFPFLYDNFPSFNMFNSPARYMLWSVFAFSILAGIGGSYWSKPVGRTLYWTNLATAGSFAIIIGALLGGYFVQVINPTFIRAAVITGIIASGAGVLTLTKPLKGSKKIWYVVSIIWIGGDLLFAGWRINPYVEKFIYSENIDRSQILEDLGSNRLYLNSEDEYKIKFQRYFKFTDYRLDESWSNLRYSLLPNLNLLENLSTINNFDPLMIDRYAAWMEWIERLLPDQRNDWLKMMSVSVIEKLDDSSPKGVRFEKLNGLDRVSWIACADFVTNGEEALQKVKINVANKRMMANDQLDYLVIEDIPKENICEKHNNQADIRWMSEQPQKMIVQIDTHQKGWVVISDTWYPGWRASLDGVNVPIKHANFLFRAVEIPAGIHKLILVYTPFWFYLGAFLSFCGLMMMIMNQKGRNNSGVSTNADSNPSDSRIY